MKNEIIEVGDSRWLVREAVSRAAAMGEIGVARATGSVGSKSLRDDALVGGDITVLADVVQINSDGTERQPYTRAY